MTLVRLVYNHNRWSTPDPPKKNMMVHIPSDRLTHYWPEISYAPSALEKFLKTIPEYGLMGGILDIV